MSAAAGVLYTNRDDTWPDFRLRGLEVVDGRLVLARLPAPAGPLPPDQARRPAPGGPAGLAVAPDGSVYYTCGDAVMRIDCDGTAAPLPCFGGTGDESTRLSGPTGLVVHPGRNALVVADTGNDRLQLFRLGSGQLIDIWGSAGELDRPAGLAVDDEGDVYVADRGNHRVQRFTPDGRVVPGFAARAGVFEDPLALVTRAGALVHVLDGHVIVTLDSTGGEVDRTELEGLGGVLGLALWGDGFVVGDDRAGGRVLRIGADGRLIGSAPGWTGPAAALANGPVQPGGSLWVHPGGCAPPVRLHPGTGHVREGVAWGGPFGGYSELVKTWQRLSATTTGRAPDAHLQFFLHTAADAAAPPPAVTGTSPDAFADPGWSAGPPDAPEHPIGAPPGRVAWLGVRLSGSGWVSAEIEQVGLIFDRPGYVPLLPAIYGDAASGTGVVLTQFLSAVESQFDEVESRIRDLSRLDPAAADPPFRAELARWLDLPADADAAAIAAAYPATARHGTAGGLERLLRQALGAPAVVEEPIRQASWWSLADESVAEAEQEASRLGVSTMMASGEPQGAVLGSTALVDGSTLVTDDDNGTPLFEPLAHRFTVRLYGGCSDSPANRRRAVDLIEQERPADTEYRICRIEPGFHLGLGGRIGIDTVVGGEPLATALTPDGGPLVLGGGPTTRIEQSSRIGVDTVLGTSAS